MMNGRGHPERGGAQSKDPAALAETISTGLNARPRPERVRGRVTASTSLKMTPSGIRPGASAQFTLHNLIDLFEPHF